MSHLALLTILTWHIWNYTIISIERFNLPFGQGKNVQAILKLLFVNFKTDCNLLVLPILRFFSKSLWKLNQQKWVFVWLGVRHDIPFFQTQRYWGYLKVIKYFLLCTFRCHLNLININQDKVSYYNSWRFWNTDFLYLNDQFTLLKVENQEGWFQTATIFSWICISSTIATQTTSKDCKL